MKKEMILKWQEQIDGKEAKIREILHECQKLLDENKPGFERLEDIENEIDSLRGEQDNDRFEELKKEYAQIEGGITQRQDKVRSLQAEIKSIEEEVRELEAQMSAVQLEWLEKEVKPIADQKTWIKFVKADAVQFCKQIKWGTILFLTGLVLALPLLLFKNEAGFLFLLAAAAGAFLIFGTAHPKNTRKILKPLEPYLKDYDVDPKKIVDTVKWFFRFQKTGADEAEKRVDEQSKLLEQSEVFQAELAIDPTSGIGYVLTYFSRAVPIMKTEKRCLHAAISIAMKNEFEEKKQRKEKELQRAIASSNNVTPQ